MLFRNLIGSQTGLALQKRSVLKKTVAGGEIVEGQVSRHRNDYTYKVPPEMNIND